MARLATTSDVFNAVAEPQRRTILNLLAQGERSVNDIAGVLRVKQPQVSKHLRVLKQVGLVSVRGSGQQRLYRLNGAGLQPIHDWVKRFEHLLFESATERERVVKQVGAIGGANQTLDRLEEQLAKMI